MTRNSIPARCLTRMLPIKYVGWLLDIEPASQTWFSNDKTKTWWIQNENATSKIKKWLVQSGQIFNNFHYIFNVCFSLCFGWTTFPFNLNKKMCSKIIKSEPKWGLILSENPLFLTIQSIIKKMRREYILRVWQTRTKRSRIFEKIFWLTWANFSGNLIFEPV